MAKGIVTKANMIFFKRMASPMMKDKMLEGLADGFVDYVKDERKKKKMPTAQELFDRAKDNKDMNFCYAKATIKDSEIMAIAERVVGQFANL